MNGIEKSLIVNLSEIISDEAMRKSLECVKCKKLSFPPCVCQKCKVCFCYNCLDHLELVCTQCRGFLTFFPENLRNLYKKLLIKCKNPECKTVVYINQFQDHQKECVHNNFNIVNITSMKNENGFVEFDQKDFEYPKIIPDYYTESHCLDEVKKLKERVFTLEETVKVLQRELSEVKGKLNLNCVKE